MVEDTLEKTKKLCWPIIDKYLKDASYPKEFQIPKRFKKETLKYWEINRVYPERKGKYIRPTLVRLVSEAMGTKSPEIIKLASAMQLSEEWMLIHDDIEDNSKTRRGGPTLHKMYGNELAINAGDSLHIIMWKMISDVNSPKITDEFYKMLLRTALGQGVEQIWTNQKKKLNMDEYFFAADGKTAYYSITGPLKLGAVLSGATSKQLNKLTEFGLKIGRCFQLVDDILDIKQDQAEGKSTLAVTKGVSFTKKLMEKYKKEAMDIFNKDLKFLSSEPARAELKEIIDFIVERKY